MLVICPRSTICEDINCEPRPLVQGTKPHDIPKVTLIKGTIIHKNVPLLTGQCPTCSTLYSADHERVLQNSTPTSKEYTSVYLNSALYLKVGQLLWVDHIFSTAVLNGMYSFHASSSAYVEFWNSSFGNADRKNRYQITCWHVWQSFVQESVQTIAASIDPNNNLELHDKLNISEVPEQAFHYLGQGGQITQPLDILVQNVHTNIKKLQMLYHKMMNLRIQHLIPKRWTVILLQWQWWL